MEEKIAADLTENEIKIELQSEFGKLLVAKFPFLQPVDKWKQMMWLKEGKLIVSLIFSAKKIKFCFFNNPNLKLDKLQRWSAAIYSQNLEIAYGDTVDWETIEKITRDTSESNFRL